MARGECKRSSDGETLLALDSDRLGMQWYMRRDAFSHVQGVFSPGVWQESWGVGARASQPASYFVTPCSEAR